MKRRITCYMVALAALLYGTVLGGGVVIGDGRMVVSATSGWMAVDTRAGKGTLATDRAVGIAYSGLWDGDADATATVAVNGRTVKTAAGEGTYTWAPPVAGTYTLTHRTTKDGVQVGETLTATFTVTSPTIPPDSFGTALDNTSLTFGTDGGAPWLVQADEFRSGGSAVRSGEIDHGEETCLTTTVSGVGTLAFWWKVSSEQSCDKLSVSVDGTEIANISGEQGWAQKTILVTESGPHTVVWTYRKDGAVSGGSDCGWVDQVAWISDGPPAPPESLGVALDNAILTFGTDGDTPWFVQSEVSHSGGSAARSGTIDHGGETRLTTTVSGPGTLSFWWKVSSERNYDKLFVSVDDVERADISGEQDWARKTVSVTGGGSHTVVWTYRKDGSVSGGSDCGWVDQVVWTPGGSLAPPNVPPVADAAWTFVRGASAAKPSVLVSPDGKWRLRAAGPEDGTVYVSFYNPLAEDESEEWEFRSCVEKGGADLALPVRARDEGNGRVYDVAFLGECFTDYTALKRVTVPDALDADLAEAFLGVPNLASFAVGGGNPRYFARDGALFVHEQDGYANVLLHYPNGKAGTAYTVPEGVEAVSAWAFGNYGKLKTVTLPASLQSWGTDSDWGNDNEWYAASRLERIELADGNPYLKVAGGALYTADGETLLRYPPARAGASATVAYGTRRIAPAAFAYAGKLTSVSLPATLRTLGTCAFSRAGLTGVEVPEGVVDISDAFCGAKKLKEVSLPSTLRRIDDGAFHDCAALKRVDLANPRISLRGDGCEDEDDYICWGEGLPAAFGIRVPAGSSVTSATSGHFHDTAKRRRAVPVLGTCPVPVLVTLRMDGGEDVTVSRLPGEKYGDALAAPGADEMAEHPGCVFRGWYTQPDGGGTRAAADDIVPAHAVTLYPWWYALPTAGGGEGEDEDLRLARFDSEEDGTAFASARTYDGYLYEGGVGTDPDGGAGGRRIAGTILVKTAAARTDRRTGRTTARATVTIQIPGERRVSLSGEMDAGTSPGFLSVTAKDGRTLDLLVGADGIAGVFDDYGIDGARNVFSSRDAEVRELTSGVIGQFSYSYGAVNLAWESTREEDGTPCGWNDLSVKVGSAGRTRITGTLADGTRVSATAQLILIMDRGWWSCCIPVVVDKKPHRLAFCLWFWIMNDVCTPDQLSCHCVEGLGGDVRFGRAWMIGEYGPAAFRIDTGALGELFGDWTYEGYGPDGVSVEQVGTKWRVAGGARPGRVVLGRDGFVDETKTGENPSALTLAYRAKEGTFTGAFKYYVPSARGAPVAKTVNVYGVVVDGVGYGTAVVRGKGAVSVMVD